MFSAKPRKQKALADLLSNYDHVLTACFLVGFLEDVDYRR
jgi:hypothetical protein